MFGSKIASASHDIFFYVNATVWGGVEGSENLEKLSKPAFPELTLQLEQAMLSKILDTTIIFVIV